MTRFARVNQSTQKAPHEATPWSVMVADKSAEKQIHKTKPSKEEKKKKKKKKMAKELEISGISSHEKSDKKSGDDFGLVKPKKKKTKPDDSQQSSIKKLKKQLKHSGDIKNKVEEVRQEIGGMTSKEEEELTDFYKKDFRRENRRIKRVIHRETDKTCFHCRQVGHDMANCPKVRRDKDHGTGICFKCGSTEHGIRDCSVRLPPGEFPFAKCFICGEKGHLSKQCPDNPKGLYPHGGCCNECGSVEHFRKDCPELLKKRGIADLCLSTNNTWQSADAEESLIYRPKKRMKTGPKVVKF